MKGTSNKLILAMLAVAVLAGAFWVMLLSPKRQEASDLSKQVQQAKSSLSAHEAEVAQAQAAERSFGTNYGQLVVLGKAVPADSETASLLVQIQHISERAHVSFEEISLESEGGGEVAAPPTSEAATTGDTGGAASPTEVAASTLPLGATIGPAGLAVMPYSLTFSGDFFHVADFIHGLDALVKTTNSKVAVDGRLITIDNFTLTPGAEGGEEPAETKGATPDPQLTASFEVTTYVTPPEQGVTAGATPSGPAESVGTPASTTTGGTP